MQNATKNTECRIFSTVESDGTILAECRGAAKQLVVISVWREAEGASQLDTQNQPCFWRHFGASTKPQRHIY